MAQDAPGSDRLRKSRSENGKIKILVLCPAAEGLAGSQRLKFEQYYEEWRTKGYDITVSHFMDEATWNIAYLPGHLIAKILGVLNGYFNRIKILFKVRHFDIVYVALWVTPFGTNFFEKLARKLCKKMIFDAEDNLLLPTQRKYGHNPNYFANLLRGVGKTDYLIRNSDHVIVGSPLFVAQCTQMNNGQRCTWIPPSVNIDRYKARPSDQPTGKITLGWTGTFSGRPFLDELRPMLLRLARERDFRLVLITNFDFNIEGIDLEVIKWSKSDEIQDLQKIDIGIYPLPDTEAEKYKGGLKAIQYMAMSLPVVASPVGVTSLIVEHGVTGFLVETDNAWLESLKCLIDDADLRRKMGARGRKVVEDRFSLQAIGTSYLDVLGDALHGPASHRKAASGQD